MVIMYTMPKVVVPNERGAEFLRRASDHKLQLETADAKHSDEPKGDSKSSNKGEKDINDEPKRKAMSMSSLLMAESKDDTGKTEALSDSEEEREADDKELENIRLTMNPAAENPLNKGGKTRKGRKKRIKRKNKKTNKKIKKKYSRNTYKRI